MEYVCPFCKKTYTDEAKVTQCTIACHDLAKARRDEEERKIRQDASTKRINRMKELYAEMNLLLNEEKKENPATSETSIFKALGIDLSQISEVLKPLKASNVYGKPVVFRYDFEDFLR